MPELENYRYSKQFIISPDEIHSINEVPHVSGWKKLRFSDNLFVYHHPALPVSHSAGNNSEVICFGQLLDSAEPKASNSDITRAIVDELTDFQGLEKRLARMGGRWVVMARFGRSTFIYHDAGGLKTVFLYKDTDKGIACVASQPALFEQLFSLQRIPELDAEMKRADVIQWPVYVYPYHDVVQLLPNHRLDLGNYEIERYWPGKSLEPIDVDQAASEVLSITNRLTRALIHRGKCHISLTAGYDSRLLVAATRDLKEHINYFTLKYPTISRYDLVIPRQMAKIWQLDHKVIPVRPPDPALFEILRQNSSAMTLHRSVSEISTLAGVVDGGFYLQGLIGEHMRCRYYKNGRHPEVTPDLLSRLTLSQKTPSALRGFSQWIKTLPDTNVAPLDLFYWEHRTGVWAASLATFREALVETTPPMNCRHLAETGMGVEMKYRMRPHELFRRIYALADERLLGLGINTTKLDSFIDGTIGMERLGRTPLLWRVKRALRPPYYGDPGAGS